MAELVLKIGTVGPDPASQDGDILCAFNRRRIRCDHAYRICDVRKFGFTSDGLRPDSIAKTFQETIHKYKFVHISAHELKRITLATMAEETFTSNTSNARGEYMDVHLRIRRMLKNKNHYIFGTPRNEFWYDGPIDVSHAKLDIVWAAIEAQTPEREVDHTWWQIGKQEKKSYLWLQVDDFDDAECELLVSPALDGGGRKIKKRSRLVDWRAMSLPVTKAQIDNMSRDVDIRASKQHLRAGIVQVK